MAAIVLFLLALTSLTSAAVPQSEEFEQKWDVKSVVPDVLDITNGDAEVVKRQTTGKIVTLSKAEKDAILNRHNELRGQVSPSAEDMEYMYWDDNEANAAEQWAAACTKGHDRGGQNLYGAGGSLQLPQAGVDATNSWYDEYKNYNYDANSCSGVCGHYTQVVWAKSTRVGCGVALCPTYEGNASGWVLICNYSPMGNLNTKTTRPYEEGPSCAGCRSGAGWCYENKCRDCKKDGITCDCPNKCQHGGPLNANECTCSCQNGWFGISCQRECTDKIGYYYCDPFYNIYCDSSPDLVAKHCPAMCGDCE
ncbi:GLIPR1-like protein 1 [Amphiura filiformis]|uniref:GLIPR1-like protein 1 n=1 Tax=Amphiura filiformis TaxID=82378 RepID=UPI003B21A083